MIINPVILGAIIVQGFISKGSSVAGAVVGYIITTGILVWGLSIYSEGNFIALLGIQVSKEIFLISCMVWYFFDTKEFINAIKSEKHVVTTEKPEENTSTLE